MIKETFLKNHTSNKLYLLSSGVLLGLPNRVQLFLQVKQILDTDKEMGCKVKKLQTEFHCNGVHKIELSQMLYISDKKC